MAPKCLAGQYWDSLINNCMDCYSECKRPDIIPSCISYCETANCKALPGHYYDGLLKSCMKCAAVCGRHPAECSQHCQTTPSPVPKLLTTQKLLVHARTHAPYSKGPTALDDPTLLLYPLLALCMVLLFSSLSLALVVFLRGARTKSSNPGRPRETNHDQECVVQPGEEVGPPLCQAVQGTKDSNQPPDREPSDDSSPTETCVCVHCFPDLKALGQSNDRPLRAPFLFYPDPDCHRAQVANGEPHRTEGNLNTSEWEVHGEAAVG